MSFSLTGHTKDQLKLLAFPSVYKAILYYKELIFLSHAWLFFGFGVLFWAFFFVLFLKMCTLNISNLISSYELKLSAHNRFFFFFWQRRWQGPSYQKITLNSAWSSNTSRNLDYCDCSPEEGPKKGVSVAWKGARAERRLCVCSQEVVGGEQWSEGKGRGFCTPGIPRAVGVGVSAALSG